MNENITFLAHPAVRALDLLLQVGALRELQRRRIGGS